MAYLGVQPTAGQYRKLDDISGSFNGSTVTFTTQVGGQNVTAGSAQSILVSLGGVVQSPGVDYTVSTNSITFTTAPTSGLSFFAILMGEAINIGTPADGSVTGAKLSDPFNFDSGTLYLDGANNRVGIGTTSPSSLLHLEGSDGVAQIRLQRSGTNIYGIIRQTSAPYGLTYDAVDVNTGAPAHTFRTSTDGSTFSERARIDSSGRLFVGTSSGRTVGSVTGNIQIEGVTDTGMTITDNSNGSAGDSTWLVLARTRGTAVGGTTAVSNGDWLGNLDFAGHNGSTFNVAARISGQVDGAVSGGGVGDMPGRLIFSTTADGASSPTERMRIGQNGQLDTYGTPVESAYTARISYGAGTIYGFFSGRHSASSTSTGTNAFFVYTNGNVVNTNGSYGVLSDLKLKENIVDASSQWDDIKAVRVRKYNFKQETGQQTHTQIGVVAQELELVSPGLVLESPDRDEAGNDLGTVTKSVNQSVLYMKAVKALQEAMERIEALEAEVAALKGA